MSWNISLWLTPVILILSATTIHFLRTRYNKKSRHELIPNRLLTRHPLVFFAGKRSMFFMSNHWNELPHWLQQHGYDAIEITTPDINKKPDLYKRWLQIFFADIPGKIHLTIEGKDIDTIIPMLHPYKNKIQSLSFEYNWLGSRLKNETENKKITDRVFSFVVKKMWRLHRLDTSQPIAWMTNAEQRNQILMHAHELAEQDFASNNPENNLSRKNFIEAENKHLHMPRASSSLET